MLLFLGFWTLLNLCQSFFTELFNDEALYWAFSERPALGYFDHPPFTAWLIALTSWIPGEIGVRLPFVLMSTGTVYLLWYLLKPKDEVLFISIILGGLIFHIGGFFAAPDIPLVFLVTLFLVLYKKYFYKDDRVLAIAMGIVLALMGWTKYHAILFVVALVLSNIELFRRPSFYIMMVIGGLFILPHLYWQWQNDWVTFDFHLYNRRGQHDWSWTYIPEFLGGQLLIYGPLISLFLFPAVVKFKQRDHYDCVMKYTFFTVMGFFLFNTFRGRVEANWTVMVMPAMVYLGYLYIETRPVWRMWVFRMAIVTFITVMAFRLILAFEVTSPENIKRNEFHGYEEWAEEIAEFAQGRPVVFINNYRKPAKYAFYADGETTSFNMAEYSGNQYDIWEEDEWELQGREVVIVSNELISKDSLHFDDGIQSEAIKIIKEYRSFNYINIESQLPETVKAGTIAEEVELQFSHDLNEEVTFPDKVGLLVYFYQNEVEKHNAILYSSLPFKKLGVGESRVLQVSFPYPDVPGEYKVKFALYYNDLEGLNSRSSFIDVE
jgi:hypothetical protein